MAAPVNPEPVIETIPAAAERIGVTGRPRRLVSDELVRAGLGIIFTLIFAGTIIASFFRLSTAGWAQTKDWLQLLLPAETALLGSATGFYFGSRRGQGGS